MQIKHRSRLDRLPGSRLARISLWLASTGFLLAADPFDQPAQYRGKAIFRDKGCIQCHSIYGEGGSGGPDLGRNKYYGTYLEFGATMWDHFPAMSRRMQKKGQKIPTFTTEEMQYLIDYLLFIRYRGEPGNVFRGRKLLRSMGCINCHKFGGEGGTLGPDISTKAEFLYPMRLVEAMWNHGPEMMELFEEHRIPHPEFWKHDIIDVAAAIQAYMAPTSRVPEDYYFLGDCRKGEILIEEKGCLHCHSLHDRGARRGPAFDSLELDHSVLVIAGKMWNHGPQMWEVMKQENLSIPEFKSGEMCNIVSFLYEMRLQDQPGDTTQGRQLVETRNCLTCHSVNGIGNKVSRDLAQLPGIDSPVAMIAAMWSHAPAMDEKRIERHLRWPVLDGRDMANLYAYLSKLNRPDDPD